MADSYQVEFISVPTGVQVVVMFSDGETMDFELVEPEIDYFIAALQEARYQIPIIKDAPIH